jgi:hypothetical protein
VPIPRALFVDSLQFHSSKQEFDLFYLYSLLNSLFLVTFWRSALIFFTAKSTDVSRSTFQNGLLITGLVVGLGELVIFAAVAYAYRRWSKGHSGSSGLKYSAVEG